MLADETLYLIPLLPLVGAAILGIIGSQLDKSLVSVIALSSVFGSFLVTVAATYALVKHGVPLENHLWTWMAVGRYDVGLTFGFDQLTAALMLVVTGVGFLIHVYSTGYMRDDPAYWRYFACLNFFICAMSILVLGRSLPVMFVGWEGVGLASYLLIGFWYTDDAKATAGKKAFITNRVGDFGFLIGIFVFVGLFGTVDFIELRDAANAVAGKTDLVLATGMFAGMTVETVVTFGCLMLFLGAAGKSAQMPLYIWLPDAMAGPTPVSALIHAATMVTAGVYMVCRMSFAFDLAETAMTVVAYVGAFTAVFAASIGLAQNDIKKVLAYSTVSQLGYMFLAAGIGAYSIAMFHVVTHAFFKACLFLGSGAVIHALHGEQDMRKMGGLRKHLPVVYWTFLISTLAISGVIGTSGFFSKDAILAHALAHPLLLGMGGFGAVLTAFYMGRLVFLTFFGEYRSDPHHLEHLHKPDWSMKAPLVILATFAVFGGVLNLPHLIGHPWLESWLQPSVGATVLDIAHNTEIMMWVASQLIAFSGLGFAWWLYSKGPSSMTESLSKGAGALPYKAVYGKWYVDELVDFVVVRPLRFVGRIIAILIDPWVIDGILVKFIPGVIVRGGGELLRRPQTGNVQAYAAMFVLAGALISGWALWF